MYQKYTIKIYLMSLCSILFSTLNASPVIVPQGGTGLTSMTAYAVLCAGTTSSSNFQPVASLGTAGQILSMASAATLPAFVSVNKEYAHIYTKGATQSIAAGAAYLFDANGLMSSGITHSTSSNTDQIVINTAGTYWFIFVALTTTTVAYISLTIDGVANDANRFFVGSAGAFVFGQFIANVTAGQIVRVVNWHSATVTITGSSTKIAASIVIKQIS